MRLKQLTYKLGYEEIKSKSFSFKNGNGFFAFNGVKTEIDLEKSFIKVNVAHIDEVKGYSFLEQLIKEEGLSVVDENGDKLKIEYSAPFWQMNDKKVDDDIYNKLLEEIKNAASNVTTEEEEDETGSSVTEPTLEPVIVQHEFGAKYLSMKDKLVKAGYVCFEYNNLGFFYKEDNKENNKILLDGGNEVEVLKALKTDDLSKPNSLLYKDNNTTIMIDFIDDKPTFKINQHEEKEQEKEEQKEEQKQEFEEL